MSGTMPLARASYALVGDEDASRWRDAAQRRWFIVAAYVAAVTLLAVPIFSVVVPPLVDYPNHLARMHILAAYADSPALRANYVVAWKLAPYIAMDAIIPSLAHVMSIYTAGRLFLYLCLVMFVLGTAAVHAALHREFSVWPTVSALFAWCFIVNYGFVNYMFGVGMWLLAFAGWIVLSRKPPHWRIIGGSVLSLAVFFSHFFAFFGYMLCVGGYELGLWSSSGDRRFTALLRRGVVAFCPFILPLIIFALASSGEEGGATRFATRYGWTIAMLTPVLFPGAPFDLPILAPGLFVAARRGLLGPLRFAPAMWGPTILLGVATLAMPGTLMGVWGVDYRLPIVLVFLLIASCSWPDIPPRTEIVLSTCILALLASHVALISWAWRPVAQQFEEFRAALSVIPRGARVIAFHDEIGANPSLSHKPDNRYDHLPMLAVIERDAYVPFLFQHKMMPVQAAPDLRPISTPVGKTIGVADMIEGANPALGAKMLGRHDKDGVHDFWGGWPANYDYAVELSFGAHPALPPQLECVASGEMFNIYRISR